MSKPNFSGKWRVVNPDLTATVREAHDNALYPWTGSVLGKNETAASWDQNGDGYVNLTRCPDIDLMERIRENA
jgi:hypothetical protein